MTREFTGWHMLGLMVGGFGIIIAVNLTLAWNAVATFPGLEMRNSYVVSQKFEADRAAQNALRWDVSAEVADDVLTVAIMDHRGAPVQAEVTRAILGRATHTGDDSTPAFTCDGAAMTAPVDLSPGYWNLRLELVAPDGRIPVDGWVINGSSQIDRALLTGESRAAAVSEGSAVTAGEINMTGPLTIRAATVGTDTTLRKMVIMVDKAAAIRNRYTAVADRAAAIYAPVVYLMAFGAFAGWMLYFGDLRLSLNIAVAVLIITCPCAMGLAVPAVSTATSGRLFRAGLLVKDGTALERLAEVDTVVFDKTGTLIMLATACDTLDGEARAVALALTQNATHPVSQAIAASLDGAAPAKITDQQEHAGKGLSARYKSQEVRRGLARAMALTFRLGTRARKRSLCSQNCAKVRRT